MVHCEPGAVPSAVLGGRLLNPRAQDHRFANELEVPRMSHDALARWMYHGKRPNTMARIMNGFWALIGRLGLAREWIVTLEVAGRRSGRLISLPLVVCKLNGERFLVSMLGQKASWVRNVRAADGHAILKHGRTEHVRLEEVPPSDRPPIIKAYLSKAPGARPHIPVDKEAPLSELVRIAESIPVFRVRPESYL